jgi:hypothetical protein
MIAVIGCNDGRLNGILGGRRDIETQQRDMSFVVQVSAIRRRLKKWFLPMKVKPASDMLVGAIRS